MSIITDVFSKVATSLQTRLTGMAAFTVKIQNFGTKAATVVSGKVQQIIQSLISPPQSKKDYFKIFGIYVSKKFVTTGLIVLGVLGYMLVSIIIPWAEGNLWTTNLKVDSIKYSKFNGKTRVYDQNNNLIFEGKLKSGKPEGPGVQYFANNTIKYKGEFVGGKYHGEGDLYGSDGIIMYSGQFENNNYHGEGKLYNNIGKVIYIGSFEVGQRSGRGIEYDPNTMLRKYYGEWANGVQNGQGVQYESDGLNIKYEGNFKDGTYEGEGKLYTNGILKYSGSFSNNLYSGFGNLYDLDTGSLIYSGNFRDGIYNGTGTLYDPRTSVILYEGSFSQGKKQGVGTSYDDLGSKKFDGRFRGDSIDYIEYLGKSPEDVSKVFGKETYKTEVDGKNIITYLGLDVSVVFKIDEESGEYVCEKLILGTKEQFMGLGAQSTAVERREVMGEPFSSINYTCPNYYKTIFSNLAVNINNISSVPSDKYVLDNYFIRFYFNDGRTELKCVEICSM